MIKQTNEVPEEQEYKVGPGKPPKEYQFKPGQSGNPKGPPVRKTQLWNYIAQYMNMTDTELEKQNRNKLTQSQQTALKVVENVKEGNPGFLKLVQYIVDRDEGKAVQTQVNTDIGKMDLADVLNKAQ